MKKKSFENSKQQLESIIYQLSDGTKSFEEMLELYQNGINILEDLEDRLQKNTINIEQYKKS